MGAANEESLEPTRRQWVGFWSMIVQQTQNAFNDKAAQFVLVPLAGAIAYSINIFGKGVGIESVAGVLIALPFVLFAPIAGWLSDRFSKRDVMVGSAIFQFIVLAMLYLAIQIRSMELALLGFFLLAIQSTFFSPAKIGINKELVGSRHLGFAAGIQQMGAMLAILIGQVAAGAVYDERLNAGSMDGLTTEDAAWAAASGPLLVLALLGLPSIVMALIVPRTPAQGAEKFHRGIAVEHLKHLRDLWKDLPLRRGAFGVAFFWGFAAFINLWSIKVAKEMTKGGEGFGSLSSWFMAAAMLGMMIGFGLSSFLLRRRIELGWVPLAGLAMTLTGMLLSFVDPRVALPLVSDSVEGIPGGLAVILTSSAGQFLGLLALLAFFAALFLAPLNAWMQDRYPPNKRGELQSAVNLQDCLAGILAVALIEVLGMVTRSLGIGSLDGLRVQVGIMAAGCGLITYYIIRLLPSDLVRVIGLAFVHAIYRVRAVNAGNMPKEGGVLLLPNHVTWVDAFLLTAASPRPVRFVMDAVYMKKPAIRWFCKLFDTVPINLGKPREALRTAGGALAAGDVICLFPEGHLTRTGTLQELKRGFELIARQAGAPIVPAWMDGAWGSVFSFERNRYFRKMPRRMPYGIGIAFGEPIPAGEASLEKISDGLRKASAAAVASRMRMWRRQAEPRHYANGHQISQINALQRRGNFAVLEADESVADLGGIAAFSRLYRADMEKVSDVQDTPTRDWIGGSALRHVIKTAKTGDELRHFYDFSPEAVEEMDVHGWLHLPCLALEGVIISMSIPGPMTPDGYFHKQQGTKAGSHGQLLPGFYFTQSENGVIIHGPAAGEGGIRLPDHLVIDEAGFVMARELPLDETSD